MEKFIYENTIKYNGKLNAIGDTIKEFRIKNNMTQKDLAEKAQLYGIDLKKKSSLHLLFFNKHSEEILSIFNSQ